MKGNMRLAKKKAKIVKSAIEAWMEEKIVSQDQGRMLLESYEIVGFDWKRLAKYSFWISIICIIISVVAIVTDDFLRELLAKLFNAPEILKCLFIGLMAALIYYYGIKRKKNSPRKFSVMKQFFFWAFLQRQVQSPFWAEPSIPEAVIFRCSSCWRQSYTAFSACGSRQDWSGFFH